MWLGDPVQYKYYDELVKLRDCLLEDYAEYKAMKGDGLMNIVNISLPNVFASGKKDVSTESVAVYSGHDAIIALHPGDTKNDLTNVWTRTVEQARKCPGTISMHINYVKPRDKINIHTDDFIWKMQEKSTGRSLEGFFISFALDIPEPENQYLVFDGVPHVWSNGEIRAFEGRHTPHVVVNNSDHYRVTAVLITEKQNNWNLGE